MTQLAVGALAASVILAIVDWWAVATGHLSVERFAKPTVVVALIVMTLTLEASVAEPVQLLVLVALGASLIGDVLLLPGGTYAGGVIAFTAAHAAYAASFSIRALVPAGLVVGTLAAALVGVVAGGPILRGTPQRLRLPTAAYLVVLLAMAAFATGTAVAAAVAGAWSFVLSDTILAWGRFVRPAAGTRPDVRVAVHVTYHVAQVLLVLSLVA